MVPPMSVSRRISAMAAVSLVAEGETAGRWAEHRAARRRLCSITAGVGNADEVLAGLVEGDRERVASCEIARGELIGDTVGMMKLLFHSDTRELLGVHIIGEGATELVHIGQAVMALGGKLDYFVDTVFNYPTLAECYKVAALAALNRFPAIACAPAV